MEELKTQTAELLCALTEEQVRLVLAYARCLKDNNEDAVIVGLEELLETPS